MSYETNEDLLNNRVYYAARDGMSMALYEMLDSQPQEHIDSIINQKIVGDDGQECTPLIIAARYGHDRVVKMLLGKYKPDLEAEGTIKFDGFVIEGVCALWAAAAAGYLNVAKTLVKAGANVDHPTTSNSTPLRAACFDGHLDIVKFLTKYKADVNFANNYGNTCLMIAAHKGHIDVVTHLLENGADPNSKAQCLSTAMHFASECGYLQVVKTLNEYGAKQLKDSSGMTPLQVAADRTRVEVVEYLLENLSLTKEEVIHTYELLGASFANDKDNYCLASAFKYLRIAMELRYSDPDNVIRKDVKSTIAAYNNWRECDSLEELDAIKYNSNSIHIESLVIKERILGTQNPEVAKAIVYRGAVYADNARFDKCVDLWLHAIQLRQSNDNSVVKDLLRFAQVFAQMIHLGLSIDFKQVINVLKASIIELEKNKRRLESAIDNESSTAVENMEEIDANMMSTLYVLTILTKIIYVDGVMSTEVHEIHQVVYNLCSLRMRQTDGQTLLHLAVNEDTPVDEFHTNDVCRFPCAVTAKLLIKCGADVNAMDNNRNTPLHIIARFHSPLCDFVPTVITDLIEAGAHVDIVNKIGKTPSQYARTVIAEVTLRNQTHLSLKCVAAKAINIYNITYAGFVPPCLESFIELHGSRFNPG